MGVEHGERLLKYLFVARVEEALLVSTEMPVDLHSFAVDEHWAAWW